MSGITVAREEDLLIDVEVPPDIVQALEQAGDAIREPAEPVEKKEPEAKPDPKVAEVSKPKGPSFSEADLEAARRQAADATARSEALAKTVDEEKANRLKSEDESLNSRFAVAHSHHLRTQAEKGQIEAHIANWENAANIAKRDLTIAREAGDAAGEAAAFQAIAKAESRIGSLEVSKANIDHAIEEARQKAQEVAEQLLERKRTAETKKEDPATPPEPKQKTPDEWIAQFPRKTASWLRENKDYVTDPSKNNEFIGFVREWAEDYGQSTVNGPQFLEALQEKFSPKPKQETRVVAAPRETETVEEEEVEINPTPQRKASAPAAPVSRSTVLAKPSGNGATTKVKLTAEQFAIAPQLYPEANSEAEARAMYAKDLLRAQTEGKFAPRE